MKKLIRSLLLQSSLLIFLPLALSAQPEKAFIKKYLVKLPPVEKSTSQQKYRMTAVYTNRDLTGNFTGKTMITGDYTSGLPGDSSRWNNVFLSESQKPDVPFPAGKKLGYIEDFTYVPSPGMLSAKAFSNFPSTVDNIFARNLIWDMLSFDFFAWGYYDSLKLNVPFIIPDINEEFEMAEIGKYLHKKIILCWNGITEFDNKLCAIISFTAADNIISLDMPSIKSSGTEQYWGTMILSLKTRQLEHAEMYSGTVQELTIEGLKDKMVIKTIRELVVEKSCND